MSGLVIGGAPVCGPANVPVRTFADEGVVRFPSKGKRASATELVIHETVTRSVASTIAVLRKRGLSVHLVMGPDGELTQHGDLATDVLWHAGPVHNRRSFGVEVVNPYYPRNLKPGLPWSRVIDAPWAHRVRIVAVMKGAAAPDHDPDRDGSHLRDEEDVARAGGVTAGDRVEVQPWLEKEQRFSFVASDPRAIDLACFEHLTRKPDCASSATSTTRSRPP